MPAPKKSPCQRKKKVAVRGYTTVRLSKFLGSGYNSPYTWLSPSYFLAHVDTSQAEFGAVLYQTQARQYLFYYASRGLSRSEKHYSSFKLEILALKQSNTDMFHDYRYGNIYGIYSNYCLTYTLTTTGTVRGHQTSLVCFLRKLSV